MSVYFMSVHIKKTRYTLAGALFASAVGIVVSVLLAAGEEYYRKEGAKYPVGIWRFVQMHRATSQIAVLYRIL